MKDISVLMPVWNGCRCESFLKMAIESILDQTYEDFEFVIVDDGSTDNTPNVLNQYAAKDERIKIFRKPKNEGIVSALNFGLEKCNCELVARQDADDMSTVTRLEIQRKFLQDRPETALCGTGMYVINEENKLVMIVNDRPCAYSVVKPGLKNGCMFVHGSVMFRKSVILSAGGYSSDPAVKHAEDYDLWVRIAKNHVVENIPDKVLYFHRNHRAKISEVYKAQQDLATRLIMEKAKREL